MSDYPIDARDVQAQEIQRQYLFVGASARYLDVPFAISISIETLNSFVNL